METLRIAARTMVRTLVGGTLAVGALEWTTEIPSQGRGSKAYHKLSDEVITPLMRRVLDPEAAHDWAIFMAQQGLAPLSGPIRQKNHRRVSLESTVFGRHFSNPIGLAAGFDKNGQVIQPMLDLGFGSVEIGSVTPQPQPGNPKPRMFRLELDGGIINRYGFNSQGAQAVEEHLKDFRAAAAAAAAQQEQHGNVTVLDQIISILFPSSKYRPRTGVVGVNIGKNKWTEDAISDYVSNIQRLGPYADYIVINVSSPNTPNLRDLQQADSLRQLVTACLKERNQLDHYVPLLVKITLDVNWENNSPKNDNNTDSSSSALEQMIPVLKLVDGIIVSNTTNQRPSHLQSPNRIETGGLSGIPIRDMSTECIRQVYELTEGEIPIIGVGGVANAQDAYQKFKAGASLVQVYTMMVYEGPGLIRRMQEDLMELMMQNGQYSLEEVIGMDHEELFWKKRQEAVLKKRQQQEEPTIRAE